MSCGSDFDAREKGPASIGLACRKLNSAYDITRSDIVLAKSEGMRCRRPCGPWKVNTHGKVRKPPNVQTHGVARRELPRRNRDGPHSIERNGAIRARIDIGG